MFLSNLRKQKWRMDLRPQAKMCLRIRVRHLLRGVSLDQNRVKSSGTKG